MVRTILLADDSMTIQKVVELTFLDRDYQVVAVSDGSTAISKLSELTPDLVIADVHMPGANGYEVCRQTKEAQPETPVLLLVGTFEQFDDQQALDAGANGSLKKPFDSQDLLTQVQQLLGNGEDSSAPADGEGSQDGQYQDPSTDPHPPSTVPESDYGSPSVAPYPVMPAPEAHPYGAAPAYEPPPAYGASAPAAPFELPSTVPTASEGMATTPMTPVGEAPPFDTLDPPPAAPSPESSFADDGSDAEEEEAPIAATKTMELPQLPDDPQESAPPAAQDPTPAQGTETVLVDVEQLQEAAVEDEVFTDPPTDAEEGDSDEKQVEEPAAMKAATVTTADMEAPSADPPAAEVAESGVGLSDEDVERIARRVAQLLGDKGIRDVAWEVVPDLAEVIIRERIRELESQAETA